MIQWIDDTVCELSQAPPADFGCGRSTRTGRFVTVPILLLLVGCIIYKLFIKYRAQRSNKGPSSPAISTASSEEEDRLFGRTDSYYSDDSYGSIEAAALRHHA